MVTTPTFWSGVVTFDNNFLQSFFSPKVTALADDSFAIVWEEGSGDIFGRRFNELGSVASVPNFLSSLTGAVTQPTFNPVLFQQADGRVVVNYGLQFDDSPLERDVFWHSVNSFTTPDSNRFGTENSPIDEIFFDATARSDGVGDFGSVIAYRRVVGTQDHVVLRFVDSFGNQASNQIFVLEADPGSFMPPVLASRHTGHVVFAYTKVGGGIGFHIYAKDETDLTGGEVLVSATGNFPDLVTLQGPGTGVHVIAWQDTAGIMFRRYSAGVALDNAPVQIADSAGLLPHIAPLKDGGFMVVWGQAFGTETGGSADFDLAIQRFDFNGNPVGNRVFVDEPGDQGPFGVSVDTLADGRVVIAFANETGDATDLTTLDYVILDPREPTIFGTNNADTIVARLDGSTIDGFAGDDILRGMDAADTLRGGDGNDTLNGGAGADEMRGGADDDIYIVDNPGDTVFESANQGTDTVRSSISFSLASKHVENLELTGFANIDGGGNSFNNVIIGNSGNNVINGRTGADRMEGKAGNDRYYVDNAGDKAIEAANEGTDRVVTTVSYSLAGQHIERLTLDGTANINGAGNSLANWIVGNSGNNVINGRTGADRMEGKAGNDQYQVDHKDDQVIEASGQGTDRVESTVSFSLSGQHIERLKLAGTADINGGGNSLSNQIAGNSGGNILNGREGNDTLKGYAGSDVFRFNTALGSNNVDTIADFQINVDEIQIDNAIFTAVGTALSASEFVANTSGTATNGAQNILYDTTDGRLFYDPDGTGSQARVHFATLGAGLALDHLDFGVI